MSDDIVLEVRGAVKSYGFVTALGGVDLQLRRGEILALLGDNGAGKTSLVRAISGIMQLDEGEIRLEGRSLTLTSAGDARRDGACPGAEPDTICRISNGRRRPGPCGRRYHLVSQVRRLQGEDGLVAGPAKGAWD